MHNIVNDCTHGTLLHVLIMHNKDYNYNEIFFRSVLETTLAYS